MNVFVDENLTQTRGLRPEPIKPLQSTTKRFGQTVNTNQILNRQSSTTATKTSTRDPSRKKKKRGTKREVETAHLDDFDRDSSFLLTTHSNELNFWKSSLSSSSLFKHKYSSNLDSMMKKEMSSFNISDDSLDLDEPMNLDSEVADSIDDLLAGL